MTQPVNILYAAKLIRKLRAIIKILDKSTSLRLAALLEANHKKPEDNSASAGDYKRGYKDGLNAGIRVSNIEEADIDINELAAAFEADECDEVHRNQEP